MAIVIELLSTTANCHICHSQSFLKWVLGLVGVHPLLSRLKQVTLPTLIRSSTHILCTDLHEHADTPTCMVHAVHFNNYGGGWEEAYMCMWSTYITLCPCDQCCTEWCSCLVVGDWAGVCMFGGIWRCPPSITPTM